ncbi:hypothetical protein H4R33_005116 [Dimargaris cristalligena]|uniref:MICOS complex subunit n=1 Tax=Dimargaris cristalligena TaxID=215637 RepID=A0A4P9ZP84_9FUNG|nr:hypothetical protein H4R33_005116 [Dimargaris cristalligena]RKP35117.1 apolipo protein O-domain-containing protein [Dimargaris cristalligena]|eukprot:RKP35117.1 apolipo protein O-domain-containing protein [Dimargaris cristalligena]
MCLPDSASTMDPSTPSNETPMVPNPKNLSIYDESQVQPQPPLGPTRLQIAVKQSRERVERFVHLSKAHGQMAVDRWIDLEHRAEDSVRNTVPKGEKLFPGALYVAVAGLAGSVFARRRNFLVRWTAPVFFAAASSFYFLPGTARTLSRRLYDTYGDEQTERQARNTIHQLTGLGSKLSHQVESTVHDARASLVDSVRSLESKSDKPQK